MTSLCGEPPGPDGISLKIQGDTRYMTETVRSLERRLKCQAFTTAFLSVLCIILIAIVRLSRLLAPTVSAAMAPSFRDHRAIAATHEFSRRGARRSPGSA